MSGETLERLLVTIEGSSELLRQELRKSGVDVTTWSKNTERDVGKLDNSLKKVATTLRSSLAAAGISVGVAGLVSFTRNAIQSADAIGEMARAAGFSAERFQRLQFVFRQNGVEAQEFGSAMRAANTRLGQFITSGAGPAAKAIEQLGLKQRIANGEIRNNEQFIDAIIDALGKVENGAERAALAAAFFGREIGAKMQDSLAMGTAALNKAAEAATGVLSDPTVRKANELADAWDRIASAAGGYAKAVAVGAVHAGARGLGIEGINGETPAERHARQREFIRSTGRLAGVSSEVIERQIAELDEYERLINTPFITTSRGDGLEEIKIGAARREAFRTPPDPFSGTRLLQPITTVGAQRAGSAADIIAARRGQRQARGLLELPLNEAAIERMKEYGEELEKARDRQQRFADAVAASFESRGFAALFSGKPRDAIRGLAQDLAELVIKMTILQPLAEALAASLSGIGGGPIGGVFGRIFGFAAGGRPPVGRASWVGERGPELWVPDVPGRIYSHAQSVRMAAASGGKAGPTFNFNAPIYADDAIGVRRAMVEAYAQAVATSDARTNAKLGAYNRPAMA